MLGRLFVLSAIAVCLLLGLSGCAREAAVDPRTQVPVVRVAVVEGVASSTRAFTGVVAARVQSDLGFRVSGKVLERLVDTGQAVERGQPLLRIDAIDLRLALRAQQEAVTAAKARAHQAAADEARFRNLRGTGAISASTYDQAKAAAETAQADVRAAQAQSELARNASRYAELVADADGVVVETLAEPGQVVVAGQVVVRIAHAGTREAVVQLPETLRPALGSTGQATLFGQGNAPVPVVLRQLSESADRLTRTFEARYVLPDALAEAPLGATVTIRVAEGAPSPAGGLQVPIGALFDAGSGPGVWLIHGSPGVVTWRSVAVDRIDDDSARITAQLEQGDRIVALGAHLLREGAQVRVLGEAPIATDGNVP